MQTKEVKVEMQKHTSKLKENDNLKLFARGGKMATRVRSSVAQLDGGYAGPMDRDSEAGFSIVYHYSACLSSIHTRTTRNTKLAHECSAVIRSRHNECKKFNQRTVSFQAELAGLPHAMSVVTNAITAITTLRDNIHAVEADLGALEALVEQVELHRLKVSVVALLTLRETSSD